MIYNWQIGQWDIVYQINSAVVSDPSKHDGWTMFETYGFNEAGFCPPLPTVSTRDYWVHVNGVWSQLAYPLALAYPPLGPTGLCLTTPGRYQFHNVAPSHYWEVVANTERATTGGHLLPGQYLYPNEMVTSTDGRFHLVYQGDGNLVLYRWDWQYLWASWSFSSPGYAIMQWDGNFVVYNAAGAAVWYTGSTWGNLGAYLTVQNDGNVRMFASGSVPIWSTGTCCW